MNNYEMDYLDRTDINYDLRFDEDDNLGESIGKLANMITEILIPHLHDSRDSYDCYRIIGKKLCDIQDILLECTNVAIFSNKEFYAVIKSEVSKTKIIKFQNKYSDKFIIFNDKDYQQASWFRRIKPLVNDVLDLIKSEEKDSKISEIIEKYRLNEEELQRVTKICKNISAHTGEVFVLENLSNYARLVEIINNDQEGSCKEFEFYGDEDNQYICGLIYDVMGEHKKIDVAGSFEKELLSIYYNKYIISIHYGDFGDAEKIGEYYLTDEDIESIIDFEDDSEEEIIDYLNEKYIGEVDFLNKDIFGIKELYMDL